MAQTALLNPWLWGLAGLGVGLMLRRCGHWLLHTRYPSHVRQVSADWDTTRTASSSVPCAQRLDMWLILGSGAGFTAVAMNVGPPVERAIVSVYFSSLLLVFVLDVAYRWVPNAVLLPSGVIALSVSAVTGHPPLAAALLGGVAGFVWFYLIAIASRWAMGAGDVKLAGLVGLMTGFPSVLVALTIGILLGGAVAALLLASGRTTRRSYMPYAPFLVTGTLLTMMLGAQLSPLARW